MALQALRGTTDLLAGDLVRWSRVEHAVRRIARLYGYQELRTPLIEPAAVFLRAVGETSEIVQKQLYRLKERGDRETVLRPEGTAPAVRAYLEHHLHKIQGFVKLFYLGPMFRAERPQAGRQRQFHQYGVEAIGSMSPWVDVEVIALCVQILEACQVPQTTVWVSSMGCRDDQRRAARRLRARLARQKSRFCEDCRRRLARNVFRVLDCQKRSCRALAWEGGASPFELCETCTAHFDDVRRGLTAAGVAFDDTQAFARGLDYYTRTVFEVRASGLGAKDAVAAGGRYDHLVEELGGPPTGACGFAAGVERVLLAAGREGTARPAARRGVYLAIAQPELLPEGFRLVQQLRRREVHAVLDYDGRSLKSQLREADRAACRLVAILGEQERQRRRMTVKDLESGAQETVPLDRFAEEMARRTHANAEKTSCH